MSFTPSGEESVAIEITAEDNASAAFASAETSALDMKQAVAGAGAVLAGAGVAGLAGAANAAADFESAMVEVEKVTTPETAEAMSSSIRELAETIPLAQKKLAGIAADAGRFGVEGPKNIEQFTKSTAKMASATNLNTQEAGQAFAKLTELTGTPISEVENLGSAINELSNNTATSAQEITDAMMRSAGALSQLGMSQTEIAGMSAALNEVSESSERAGTRLRRLGQEMMNPKKAGDLASALGMTTSEFETMREEAPNEMLLAMAEAMASGGDQADELKDALSTTSRQALTGLAQNIDGTRKALEMSSTAYEENTSVQEEFNASADTFNKQLQMLRNRLRNVAIVMGNQILPVLVKAMDAVTPLIDNFADLNERLNGMPALLATVGVTLAGLGAVAVSVGPAIVGALSPILGPVAAITAAVGVLYYVWTNDMGGIQDATKEMLRTLQTVFNEVLDVMKAVFEEYVMPLLKELQQVWETEFRKIMNEVVKTMAVIRKKIKVVLRFVRRFWNKHGTKIRKIVDTYFGAIELVIKTTMRAISALIRSILALIRGDFDRVLKIVKNFWTKTFDDILAFLKEDWLPGLKATLRLFSDFIKNIFRKIYNFLIGGSIVPKTFNEILAFIKSFVSKTRQRFASFFTNLKTQWTEGLRAIVSWVSDKGASLFGTAFGVVRDTIYNVFNEVTAKVTDTVENLIDTVVDELTDIAERVEDAFEKINVDVPVPDIPTPDIPSPSIGGGGDGYDSTPDYGTGDDDLPGGNLGGGAGDDGDGGYDDTPDYGSDDDDLPGGNLSGGVGDDDDESDGGDGGGYNGPASGYSPPSGAMATGGIVTDAMIAMMGEGRESEAVLPLSRLSAYLDRAYEVGANTAPSSASRGGQKTTSALNVTLAVDGDGALEELIREHAELVVEERDARKRARIARN